MVLQFIIAVTNRSRLNVLRGHHCIQYAHGLSVLEIQSGPRSKGMSVACDVGGLRWEDLNDYSIGCLDEDNSKDGEFVP